MQSEIQSGETAQVVEPANDRYADFESTDAEDAKAKPAEPAKVEPEPDIETDDEEHETSSEGEPKRKKRGGGWQKKIARLEAENARLRQLEPTTQPVTKALEEPKPEDYPNDWDGFRKAERAYDRQVAKQEALEAFESKQRETEGKKEFEVKKTTFNQKQDEARQVYADYDEALAEFDDVPVNPAIHQAMLESDVGAEIAYHLAKNPELFEKLNDPNLSVVTLGRELGKIEASLEGKNSGKVAAVRTSKAPPPISPVKPSAVTSNKSLEEVDYEEYYARRQKERG